MDVDTPPRALPPPTTFSPSSCEVSADLFGFQTPMETDPTPIPSTSTLPPFNSKEFDAKESFGLATPSASPSDSLIIAETRRRKPIKKERIERRSSSSSRSDVEEDLNDSNAFGGIVANRMGKGAFSFQVHHHHGQNSNGFDNSPVKKKKWLDKSTPYTLLG